MEKLANFIVNKRYVVILLFILLTIYSIFGISLLDVQEQTSTFLPVDSNTAQAVDVLSEEFNDLGQSRILITNISLESANELVLEIEALDGVRSLIFDSSVDFNYEKQAALFYIFFDGNETCDVSLYAFNTMINILEDSNYEFFVPRHLVDTRPLDLGQSIFFFIVLAIIIVFIVLTLTTKSYITPLIFFIVFIVGVLINMGTNHFLGTISPLAIAITPLLQVFLSMDYANIVNNCLEEEKHKHPDDFNLAMKEAVKQGIPEIIGASSTTVLGLLAIATMTLGIGVDLGLILAKGIVISALTIIFLLPVLFYVFNGLISKTQHKIVMPNVKPLGEFSIKYRKVLMPIFLIATLIFSFFALTKSQVYSLDLFQDSNSHTSVEYQYFGTRNNIYVLIPHSNEDLHESLENFFIINDEVIRVITSTEININGDNHYKMIVTLNLSVEGDETFLFLEELIESLYEISPYILLAGNSLMALEIRNTFSTDYLFTTIVSFLAILTVLIILFKTFKESFMVSLIIQAIVFITFGATYAFGVRMFYFSVLLLVILLKTLTVDFALVVTSRYEVLKLKYPPQEAIIKALTEGFPNIVTSGSIVIFVSLINFFITNDPMIAQLSWLLAAGMLLSVLVVIFILPGFLYTFFKKPNTKKYPQALEDIKK